MTATARDLEDLLTRLVRDVPDFPQQGVVFKDICPLLADHRGFAAVVEGLSAFGRDDGAAVVVDKVVGVESRGFILAAPVALNLGVGFVPVRKAGRLPGPTYRQSYALEYGDATLEIQRDAFGAGDRVLLVDDVLATGGTANATAALVDRAGAQVTSMGVLIELGFLAGREAVAHLDLHALLRV
ncbi:MAG: adenine phosphoribosyltransferase [Propionibacteriales bacterium]|nr:adenine phosphoribosyltransferase [Propionibacteriales bacterium]